MVQAMSLLEMKDLRVVCKSVITTKSTALSIEYKDVLTNLTLCCLLIKTIGKLKQLTFRSLNF
jgi:hypothetical protein